MKRGLMKKGLSPLISAVLLIAFVVTLFLVITNWIQSGVVEEVTSRTEEKLGGQLDCLSTSISISGVCVDSIDPATDATNVKVNVDNTGDTTIESVTIRVLNVAGDLVTASNKGTSSPPLGRILTAAQTFDGGAVITTPTRIEVYPVIGSGTCQDQVKLVTSVPKC